METDKANEKSFQSLVGLMKDPQRPLALLGAGISVGAGYPTWVELLKKLEAAAGTKLAPKYKEFLSTLNDPAWQAEEYERIIGKHYLSALIANEFAYKGKISPVHEAIVQLRFRHLLTTNYDSCLEEAYKLAHHHESIAENASRKKSKGGRSSVRSQSSADQFDLQAIRWTEQDKTRQFFLDLSRTGVKPYLVYLHGCFHDAAQVILTESSYSRQYAQSDAAQMKLFAILITQPIIFIGFSVNDPDLNHLMREAYARLGIGKPPHFALMGYEVEEQRELIKNRMIGKYGIEPVFYKIRKNEDNSQNHDGLLELLKNLHQEVNGSKLDLRAKTSTIEKESEEEDEEEKEKEEAITQTSPRTRTPKPIVNPLDRQKGRWGGESESNHRRLKIDRLKIYKIDEYCVFDLVVESSDPAQPLEGYVTFHLHQTYTPETRVIDVKNGEARLEEVSAYGAFTVGAEADKGNTHLELDLVKVKGFPQWFKDR